MSRICPLFSGSTGNSTYISGPSGSLLIDAGVSLRSLSAALEAAGGRIDDITDIFITHEHADHIKGLSPFLKKTGARVIASEKTLSALICAGKIPAGIETLAAESGKVTEIPAAAFIRFATPHDCDGSSGYCFFMPDNVKISVCTDLGKVTDEIRQALRGSNAVLLESNHDIEMLKKGPYPPELKMRILSDTGHISNSSCACELPALLEAGTTRFILGHLSRHNNTPLLALSSAEAVLTDAGAQNGSDYILTVAAPSSNRVTVV